MKRAVSLVLALVLCFAFAVPAAAADTAPKTAADLLNGLGLFKGAGTDANGAPEYQLDRPATRIEALVMLIRLIGREEEALAFTGPNPFNDVPAWADRYAAFAYSEKLATGRTPTTYDASGAAEAKDYLTFVLRALGYDDHSANPPFTYNDANSFAMKLGLVNHIYGNGEFLRGDAAVASACALKLKKNGSDTTLIQSLVTGGAVTPNAAHNAGFADVTAMPASEEGKKIEIAVDENGTITAEAVHAVLPQAKYIYEDLEWHPSVEYMESLGVSLIEYRRNPVAYYARTSGVCFEFPHSLLWYSDRDTSKYFYYVCILDGDLNIIAEHMSEADSLGNGKITFTRTYIDTESIYDTMMERINASLANKDSLEVFVDVNDPQGIGWDDGGGMAYHYPVYINGKEMTSEYRISYNVLNSNVMSIDDFLIWSQFETLYNPSVIVPYDENGNRVGIYDTVLSEEGSNAAYGQVWDAQTGEIVEEHFGLYIYEKNIKEFDMVVMIYDPAGNLLGYTII